MNSPRGVFLCKICAVNKKMPAEEPRASRKESEKMNLDTVAQSCSTIEQKSEAVIYGMTDYAYHAHPRLGSSLLRKILTTPADFLYASSSRQESTPALLLGTAVHASYLQPIGVQEQIAMQPEDCGPRNSGDGKKRWDAFKKEHEGKIVLGWDDAKTVLGCVAALTDIRPLTESDRTEVTAFADIEGVELKARADLDDGEILWDVKTTTEELDEYNLSKSIASYGYHFQAAHYLEVFEAAGAPRKGFGIIWVNKAAPHHSRITLLSDEFLAMGRNDFHYSLQLLNRCRATDVWPGYPREITTLSPPTWLA